VLAEAEKNKVKIESKIVCPQAMQPKPKNEKTEETNASFPELFFLISCAESGNSLKLSLFCLHRKTKTILNIKNKTVQIKYKIKVIFGITLKLSKIISKNTEIFVKIDKSKNRTWFICEKFAK
jgi:hypothetical protein